MTRIVVLGVVLAMLGPMAWTLPAIAQASTQTASVQAAGSQEIAQTLEALRTLLQSTEARLEQVETRLAAQDDRVHQLQGTVDDLQQRVEGQLSILSERVSAQRAQLGRLQTIGILAVVILLVIVVAGLVAQARRLQALEALQDHVDRGVEQDDAEEPPQQ